MICRLCAEPFNRRDFLCSFYSEHESDPVGPYRVHYIDVCMRCWGALRPVCRFVKDPESAPPRQEGA